MLSTSFKNEYCRGIEVVHVQTLFEENHIILEDFEMKQEVYMWKKGKESERHKLTKILIYKNKQMLFTS